MTPARDGVERERRDLVARLAPRVPRERVAVEAREMRLGADEHAPLDLVLHDVPRALEARAVAAAARRTGRSTSLAVQSGPLLSPSSVLLGNS